MFKSVLIANRGEIACRIARTCRKLGLRSIAVYSDADATSPHLAACDDACYIGESESAASYLNIEAILDAALESGAEAIHPGYGFLSENATFAKKVKEAGIVFIGPDPETITLMGDKIQAKSLAVKAGVPVVPGLTLSSGNQFNEKEILEKVGLPLLIKAAGGGGGRGMRIVRAKEELQSAIQSASREALSFFKDATVFIEKLVEGARHIEVQIFGTADGVVHHFGTRDCTFQRNHQKVIEEAPAAGISEALRQKLHESALSICKTAGYKNAGTVEFLVKDESFYFLEVNSRLQVEHPVTEEVYGVDLVELQLRTAAGENVTQLNNIPNGHAIQCRLCSESPRQDFQADTGMIVDWKMPHDVSRVDDGYHRSSVVSHYYDSLIGKIIVHRSSREDAINGSIAALTETVVTGVRTNLEFLLALLREPSFHTNSHDTKSAHAVVDSLIQSRLVVVPLAAFLLHENITHASLHTPTLDAYRINGNASCSIHALINGSHVEREICFGDQNSALSVQDNLLLTWALSPEVQGLFEITAEDHTYRCYTFPAGNSLWITGSLGAFQIQRTFPPLKKEGASSAKGSAEITSPLPGKILTINVKEGDSVAEGQTIAVIESMKMEHMVTAPRDGVISQVLKSAGATIQRDEKLFVLSDNSAKTV